jgi:hypothetical protein
MNQAHKEPAEQRAGQAVTWFGKHPSPYRTCTPTIGCAKPMRA